MLRRAADTLLFVAEIERLKMRSKILSAIAEEMSEGYLLHEEIDGVSVSLFDCVIVGEELIMTDRKSQKVYVLSIEEDNNGHA